LAQVFSALTASDITYQWTGTEGILPVRPGAGRTSTFGCSNRSAPLSAVGDETVIGSFAFKVKRSRSFSLCSRINNPRASTLGALRTKNESKGSRSRNNIKEIQK
jgi:hypothetical protein